MFKFFSKIIIILISILIVIAVYLSFFGIETDRFNKIIYEKIININPEIRTKIKKVKIFLNIKKLSLDVKIYEPNLLVEDKSIKFENIKTNISIISYFKKEFSIQNLEAATKLNEIKDLIKFLRSINQTVELFIIDKVVKKGKFYSTIKLKFNKKGKIDNNFIIDGKVIDAEIKFLNKEKIKKVNLDFSISNNNYNLEKVNFNYKKIKLNSKKIFINLKNNKYNIDGELSNKKTKIDNNKLKLYLTNKNFNLNNLTVASSSKFKFSLDKKYKLSNLKLETKLDLKQANIEIPLKNNIKKNIKNFENKIFLKNNIIDILYENKNYSVKGKGEYSINNNFDKLNYVVQSNKNGINFNTYFGVKDLILDFKLIEYKKKLNQDGSIKIVGNYFKNQNLNIKNFSFVENKNKIEIDNIKFKKSKLVSFDSIILELFDNNNHLINNAKIIKNKNIYTFNSKILNITKILNNYIESKNDSKLTDFFYNLNAKVLINFKKTYLNDISYLNNLNGTIIFDKNELTNLLLNSNFSDDKLLNFSISKNKNDEKITTFYSGHAKPFVEKYKFIKGFKGGELNLYSVTKNQKTKSKLNIINFKLNEVPALTKILTLASLQGIADLLTGEGIRFNELEMDFINDKKIIKIEELYAIGPSISILMDGYIEKNKLVSLRGTLVPATTLNKVIASIPIFGEILVGKKTGEGIFGVSFKIKGEPKNLKTFVNPVKTLTPRFITRTLEKIKKINTKVKQTP